MATKDYSFPGIYPQNGGLRPKKPGLKMSDYFKALYDKKLDRKNTPNTFYAVDENGHQIMVDINQVINIEEKVINILNAKDAPADNKQYARENKQWQEVKLQKLKLENTLLDNSKWISGGGSEDYPYEYRIYNDKIKESMVPEVTFTEADSLTCNFSPVCNSHDGYVSIYANEIPETEITIPLITLQ